MQRIGACRICGSGARGPYCQQCKREGLHREYATTVPAGDVVRMILAARGYGETAVVMALEARAKAREQHQAQVEAAVPITALADRLRQAWGVA
jgi:hypothetical protein